MSEVITVRIDHDTKTKIKKHKIDVADTVRRALRKEIERRDNEELRKALAEAGEILRKIPKEELVRSIRDSREER
jgi:hypothetical protein